VRELDTEPWLGTLALSLVPFAPVKGKIGGKMKHKTVKTILNVIAILLGGVALTVVLVLTAPDHLRTIGERLGSGL
jgi:hypothetical protein